MIYTEDELAQKPLADCLANDLGWESVYAHNSEKLGAGGTLGRRNEREVALVRYLDKALRKLNPGFPEEAYKSAVDKITETAGFQSGVQINREKYDIMRNGAKVSYRNKQGKKQTRHLKVFDFDNPQNNHFLCVRELRIQGDTYLRRADIVGFVNGLPLLFVECKRPDKNLRRAYDENIVAYRKDIPQAFYFNAFIMLANGFEAKIGSTTAKYEHFSHWKRLSEGDKGDAQIETLVKGVCDKSAFLDILENFILFDGNAGGAAKILARNHQYLGVNAAFEAVKAREKNKGKLGVYWHTQGAGKSYSMAFFAQKIRRKLGIDFTFLMLTDRKDLDNQIYQTFADVKLTSNDQDLCRAESGAGLRAMLSENKAFVFGLIQKFNQEIKPGEKYSTSSKIIVMTDEAHRTQYGKLAKNMRAALPNAAFIGFTGTPLLGGDQITRRVFGDYVSKYDFLRAEKDNATLPLKYASRGEKLNIEHKELNENLAKVIDKEGAEDIDIVAKLRGDLKKAHHVLTADDRLEKIAKDFVNHCSANWEAGKAMFVAVDKITAVKMHGLILAEWKKRVVALEGDSSASKERIAWMRETKIAVVISEEQGEAGKFEKEKLDIAPHRKLINNGFTLDDGSRLDLETAFKREEHPFRVVIVCAMWLTGFDVPALSTLYLDRPMQNHTLMQAIARVNRLKEGKNHGLIVDYCGILKNLHKALLVFADGGEGKETNFLRPVEELLAELRKAIKIMRDHLSEKGFDLSALIHAKGAAKNKALISAKEAINANDETRKQFEVSARNVFAKYKACLPLDESDQFRMEYEAINFVYKILQEDRLNADTSGIVRKLRAIVSKAISTVPDKENESREFVLPVVIKEIRKALKKSKQSNSDIQAMKSAIEKRLERMLAQNPTRTDFQARYDEVIAKYNSAKDQNNRTAAREGLVALAVALSEEEKRYVKEGFKNEDELAIFDLIKKPELEKEDIKKIKKVSAELLNRLLRYLEEVQGAFSKQTTSEGFKEAIIEFLFDENTGLPQKAYNNDEIEPISEEIYGFFKRKNQRRTA